VQILALPVQVRREIIPRALPLFWTWIQTQNLW
jgi:hypothetical protein